MVIHSGEGRDSKLLWLRHLLQLFSVSSLVVRRLGKSNSLWDLKDERTGLKELAKESKCSNCPLLYQKSCEVWVVTHLLLWFLCAFQRLRECTEINRYCDLKLPWPSIMFWDGRLPSWYKRKLWVGVISLMPQELYQTYTNIPIHTQTTQYLEIKDSVWFN